MKNKILVIGIIALMAIIVVGLYLYSIPRPIPTPNGDKTYQYSEITYDDCSREKLRELRTLLPASEEQAGTERLDKNGNIWIKQEDGGWKTEAKGYENTGWGDALIDEQPGGANYIPDELPECEKYIFTRNDKLESGFTEIVDAVIQEQSSKGIMVSVEEIEVLNLVGRLQGFIKLNCNEDMNYEIEEEVIESIANKLFVKYPDEFAEGSERDSWVDVNCVYDLGWRISDGYYDILI